VCVCVCVYTYIHYLERTQVLRQDVCACVCVYTYKNYLERTQVLRQDGGRRYSLGYELRPLANRLLEIACVNCAPRVPPGGVQVSGQTPLLAWSQCAEAYLGQYHLPHHV